MRKYPITWTPIDGLPGCYDHDHRALLPKDHAVMIQQLDDKKWRVYYTIPYAFFLQMKEMKLASEGAITISRNPFQFTVTHDLGSFNRCKIAGRFYIETYIGETADDTDHEALEPVDPRREEQSKRPPL
jgi:hypothetical protein